MSEIYEKLQKSLESIRKVTDFVPEIGITLGSGLGGLSEKIEKVCEISYKDIEGFPVSTVSGHDGKFIFGMLSGRKVVVMSGRVHYYEGYRMMEVVTPVRIMGLLGAKIILLTNAAGGINIDFNPGDLMLIKDHISVFVPNPLIGQNADELGTRFPDMSSVYDKQLQVSAVYMTGDIKGSGQGDWSRPSERCLRAAVRSELRDTGRDKNAEKSRSRRSRHEYCGRSYSRKPHGASGSGYLLHHEYGSRHS